MPLVDLTGAIDMHCHFAPDAKRRRSVDALEAAVQARSAGHAGLVLKSHDYPSAPVAALAGKVVEGIRVFGGICCDAEVGGLNPAAVEASLRLGAKVVWLPTHSARIVDRGSASRPTVTGGNICTLTDDGELLGSVHEILDLLVEHDAVLATGHVSVREHFAVTAAFASRGRVLVTHAREAHAQPDLSVADCVRLADMGATIELSAVTCLGSFPCRPVSDLVDVIHAVGADHCVVSTDMGQRSNPKPAEGLQQLADALYADGVKAGSIRTMTCRNPASLLGVG